MDVHLNWAALARITDKRQYLKPTLVTELLFEITGDSTHLQLSVTPPVIVWDPISQYGLELMCPFHPTVAVKPDLWKNSDTRRPRQLYHTHGIAYLIARQYYCPGLPPQNDQRTTKHHLSNTDDGFLQQLSAHNIQLPFRLTHRSGVTTELAHYIIQR